MNKLIKLSVTHYIVVDNSEIKEEDFGNYYFHYKEGIVFINFIKGQSCLCNEKMIEFFKGSLFKITHSTQPLEGVEPLSLSEIEEAIYGYSVRKMAWNLFGGSFEARQVESEEEADRTVQFGIECINAHKELVKDKVFTGEQIVQAIAFGFGICKQHNRAPFNLEQKEFIQSLLPKTEWDCKVVNGKIELI